MRLPRSAIPTALRKAWKPSRTIRAAAPHPGPKNPAFGGQFPSSEMPLSTDSGDMPNFWFPFAAANKRLQDGGWARQVTVNELPIAKTLAAVDMYLTAGGIRELHWHLAAEWAFVLYGSARITAFDQDGRSFVADVKAGDLWNFPSGTSALDPGARSRRHRIPAGIRRWRLFRIRYASGDAVDWRIRRSTCWPRTFSSPPRLSIPYRCTRNISFRRRCLDR